MASVKRRLVYVADENEALLHSLTGGSPPTTCPSRLSRIHVTPSSSGDELPLATPPPLPVGAATVSLVHQHDSPGQTVDPLLLVSYDGYLLADGTGTLYRPRNPHEAARLRVALHVCRTYLREYAQSDASPDPLTPATPSSVATSDDDDGESTADYSDLSSRDSDSDSESGRSRHKSRARAGKQPQRVGAATSGSVGSISALTVAQLREELRVAGLPVTGNKATLVARLCERRELISKVPSQSSRTPASPSASASVRRSQSSQRASGPSTSTMAPVSPVCAVDKAASTSDFRSPNSARSSIGGLWGTIVNVGSLFFRPSLNYTQRARSAAGEVGGSGEEEALPPVKQQRRF